MRTHSAVKLTMLGVLLAVSAEAQTRYMVRILGAETIIQSACSMLHCTVQTPLDGEIGQLYLVTTSSEVDPNTFVAALVSQAGIVSVEMDARAKASEAAYAVPAALTDSAPVSYYGSTVIHGYVNQPATILTRLPQAQTATGNSGSGIVAVIDTGVDPSHPALQAVLLPGYDFTRNSFGADETIDLPVTNVPSLEGAQPAWTNSRSSAVVTQSTAAVIDGNSQYGDFGHGTMVAGVVHLTAPTAQILPLKAFQADGTGYNSDIIRAIYFAIEQRVSVINMSFNLAGYSQEVRNALNTATLLGIVNVASAGNEGTDRPMYPASYPNVISVASTSNSDQLSAFSSYGSTVWLAAPGEGVVTTYPFATYAAAWGTSFSAPFVSGTVALMHGLPLLFNQGQCAGAVGHADSVTANTGKGRLNILKAIEAWTDPSASRLF